MEGGVKRAGSESKGDRGRRVRLEKEGSFVPSQKKKKREKPKSKTPDGKNEKLEAGPRQYKACCNKSRTHMVSV